MDIVLASASPRRAELLRQAGLTFRVVPSRLDEGKPVKPWAQWVRDAARFKAESLLPRVGEVILAADTIVVMGERVLGKPQNKHEAAAMLEFLSGRVHEVMTGICVVHMMGNNEKDVRIYQDVEITKVYFRNLTAQEIAAYVASAEPLDKAGAYGIQGLGALLVERIEGCYFNVVGLPLVKTMQLLRRCGVAVLGESKSGKK